MSKGFISWQQIWSKTWKRLIAGFIMLIVVLLIGRGSSGSVLITLLQIAGGASIYAIMLVLLKDAVAGEAIVYIKKKTAKLRRK